MAGYWVPNSYTTLPYARSVESSGGCITPAYRLHAVESLRRKTDYELTEVTIRVLGSDDPDPTPETYTRDSGPIMVDNRQTSILTYRSRNAEPQRQSKRIRTVKRKVRRIGISKQMSVKDIKLLVCHVHFYAIIVCILTHCLRSLVAGRTEHSHDLPAAVLSGSRVDGQQRERGDPGDPGQRRPRLARGAGERRAA
jgi:hypothetical protein